MNVTHARKGALWRMTLLFSLLALASFTATAWAGSNQWFNNYLAKDDGRVADTARPLSKTVTHNFSTSVGNSCTGTSDGSGNVYGPYCANVGGADITRQWCGCPGVQLFARGKNAGQFSQFYFYKEWPG